MKIATTHMKENMAFGQQQRGLPGKVAYAIFSGVCGTLLLVGFCTAFLNLLEVVKYLPWMIAFNTAMTGFSLIEKTRDSAIPRHIFAVCAGLANVIITSGLLVMISFYFLGENLFGTHMFLLFLVIGAACSALGAWLAVSYFK